MQATSCEERQTLKQRPRVSNAHGRERHLGCPDMIASVANNDGVNRRASMLGAHVSFRTERLRLKPVAMVLAINVKLNGPAFDSKGTH